MKFYDQYCKFINFSEVNLNSNLQMVSEFNYSYSAKIVKIDRSREIYILSEADEGSINLAKIDFKNNIIWQRSYANKICQKGLYLNPGISDPGKIGQIYLKINIFSNTIKFYTNLECKVIHKLIDGNCEVIREPEESGGD